MSTDKQNLRLEGIYPQRQKDFFMQRVKLPAGLISADQALKVAQVARRAARGVVHLTTRGSIELHWLTEADLAPVAAQLASVGLINRGACGGAVRGVVCGSLSAAGAPALEALARRIHRHFTGNPRFESLPKKFKIGIEADPASRRHLIQDVGLLPAAAGEDGGARYDLYVAGGLGREPVPGFLLTQGVPEGRILPLIETILRVYEAHTPAGKRLKHLVREIGREEFVRRVLEDPAAAEELPAAPSLAASLVPVPESERHRLEVPVFAGELSCAALEALARIAERYCGGILMVTATQNVALHLAAGESPDEAWGALREAGLLDDSVSGRVTFQVCPGNHECVMGIAATREIAAALLQEMGPAAQRLTWAISGCPNCCAQPQLAQAGIVVSRLLNEEGVRTPRFDLYREGDAPFADLAGKGLSTGELLEAVREIG